MSESPKGKFRDKKDNLTCSCTYVLEYLYVYEYENYESHKDRLNIFTNAYNSLYVLKQPRVYIDEMIILVRFLKKFVQKIKNKKFPLNK